MAYPVQGIVLVVRDTLARNVGAQLARLRLKPSDAAGMAECSPRTLDALLHRDVGVGIDRVAALASVLECSPSFLLDDRDVCAPPTSSSCDARQLRMILGVNVKRSYPLRGFANLTALASAAMIAKTQLYDIIAARCSTSIDCVALLGVPLGVRACELLTVI